MSQEAIKQIVRGTVEVISEEELQKKLASKKTAPHQGRL